MSTSLPGLCFFPLAQDIARTITFSMLSLFRAQCSTVAPRTMTRSLQISARLGYPKGPNASNIEEDKQNEANTQDQDKKTMPGMSSDVRSCLPLSPRSIPEKQNADLRLADAVPTTDRVAAACPAHRYI